MDSELQTFRGQNDIKPVCATVIMSAASQKSQSETKNQSEPVFFNILFL